MRKLLIFSLLMGSFALAQTRIIPHVTRLGGGFETNVLLSNVGDKEGTVTLTAYEQLDGELIGTTRQTVSANATSQLTINELFGVPEISHFTIEGDSHVMVSVTYKSIKGNTGPAHVRETSEAAYRWRIYLGNKEVTWDGLVIVNMGKNDTPLTVFGYDREGRELDFVSPFWPLKPMEKEVYFLTDLFGSNPDYFEFVTAEPVAVMALRGEHDNRFLWKNDALPMAFDPTPQ